MLCYNLNMALISNRKAYFNYEILEKYEAGLVLVGHEVKAIRAGRGQMHGAYVVLLAGEAWLKGLTITPLQQNNVPKNYIAGRKVKLLLNKKELVRLYRDAGSAGNTLVPLGIYEKAGNLKCEIALVRGKKLHDKRESLKKRADEREIARDFKRHI